jgi:hypothetical protein
VWFISEFLRIRLQDDGHLFVVEFVSELDEWNRFVFHENGDAVEDWIEHVAFGAREAAIECVLDNLPAAIPQATAPDDRINFPNE